MIKKLFIVLLATILAMPAIYAVDIEEVNDNGELISQSISVPVISEPDEEVVAHSTENDDEYESDSFWRSGQGVDGYRKALEAQRLKQSHRFVHKATYSKPPQSPFNPCNLFLIAGIIYLVFKIKRNNQEKKAKQQLEKEAAATNKQQPACSI